MNYNFQYRFPLLDKDLIEFYIAIPNKVKIHREIDRYIYRMAIRGIAPDKIFYRTDKKGHPAPNIYYRLFNDIEKILDIVKSESFLNDRYVNKEKIVSVVEEINRNRDVMKDKERYTLLIRLILLHLSKNIL